jgi:DNA ligase-1
MLAGTHTDVARLIFPLLASQKLDGLRATVQGGVLLSRSLKPLPNKYVQELFGKLPEGLDGELVVGNTFAPDAFRKTTSLVMSDDKPLDFFPGETLVYRVFDRYHPELGFRFRLADAVNEINALVRASLYHVVPVPHTVINNLEELNTFEASMLDKGAEGVMVRNLDGPYKQGRATEKSGDLVKVKRFEDSEAEITGSYEEMYNGNEATISEVGRTKRSSAKEGLVPKGTLGGLEARDVKSGVEFKIGAGFTADQRAGLWLDRPSLVGQIVKYKFFPTGGKEKPRHPTFLGFRDKRDM